MVRAHVRTKHTVSEAKPGMEWKIVHVYTIALPSMHENTSLPLS